IYSKIDGFVIIHNRNLAESSIDIICCLLNTSFINEDIMVHLDVHANTIGGASGLAHMMIILQTMIKRIIYKTIDPWISLQFVCLINDMCLIRIIFKFSNCIIAISYLNKSHN